MGEEKQRARKSDAGKRIWKPVQALSSLSARWVFWKVGKLKYSELDNDNFPNLQYTPEV